MRLFAAIPLTEPVRTHLAAVQTELRRRGRGSFPPPENLHLTLAFLGETDREPAARAALEKMVGTGAFSLTVEGLGRFGDVWWAGVGSCPALDALALGLQASLRQAGFGLEDRAWRPHITLVRRYRLRTEEAPPTLAPAEMAVRRAGLLASVERDGRRVYVPRLWVEL